MILKNRVDLLVGWGMVWACRISESALTAMATRHEFDTMLMALNHQGAAQGTVLKREQMAIPAAHKKGMGVMVMKVVRPRETVEGLDPADLIRYALTLPMVTGAVIAMDSIEVVDKNVQLLRTFKPLSQKRMDELTIALNPFYEGKDLAWMQPGYQDGVSV